VWTTELLKIEFCNWTEHVCSEILWCFVMLSWLVIFQYIILNLEG